MLSFAIYLLVFLTTAANGNALIKRHVPIDNNQELCMMYMFHSSFKHTTIYKPRVNHQSQEYYLIGLEYTPISPIILGQLIDFLGSYKLQGIVDIKQIPDTFLTQIIKAQNMLLDSLNDFIRKKTYFAENFTELTEKDWKEINRAIKTKIKGWFAEVPLKKKRGDRVIARSRKPPPKSRKPSGRKVAT